MGSESVVRLCSVDLSQLTFLFTKKKDVCLPWQCLQRWLASVQKMGMINFSHNKLNYQEPKC